MEVAKHPGAVDVGAMVRQRLPVLSGEEVRKDHRKIACLAQIANSIAGSYFSRRRWDRKAQFVTAMFHRLFLTFQIPPTLT
jgi:hypothetical protein